jgi:hypothetical protein
MMFMLVIVAMKLCAQESAGSSGVMKQILERLDSLEKENRELAQDVRALRQELAASRSNGAAPVTAEAAQPNQASLEERVTVEEQRTAEQAQTKVEASHKFPIQLNGMVLFNAFANSAGNASEYSDNYNLLTGPNRDGATLRQTLLGLDFQGPHLPGNGRVNGSITMDFSSGSSDPEYIRLRLRRADISLDWANRSFSIGQDKPLISPYQPDSLAEVGIPPLAGAGNLWLWLPQARYEERLHLGTSSGINAQLSVMQTEESYATLPPALQNKLEETRPALEGRFAFWHKIDDTRRFELAPGFHVSTTHVAGSSVASHIGSLDWLIVPGSHLQFSGTVFKGQNVAGLGALGNGFTITPKGDVRPVNSAGGWAQAAFPITNRLTFNVFSGLENDHSPFLTASNIVHNWTYAANLLYHLGPNVVVGLEALQMRTRSFAGVAGLQNHYDLALGYLF